VPLRLLPSQRPGVGKMRWKLGIGVALLLACCIASVTWSGVGVEQAELLGYADSLSARGATALQGGGGRHQSLEAQREALERKIQADEASSTTSGDGGAPSSRPVAEKDACGRLCQAKRAILKVKGELDKQATGSLQMLVRRMEM
jgi:hypothetical protein